MSTATTSDRISRILALVGSALLLPWPARSKGGRRRWKHLQLTDMHDDRHLAKLEKAGNIGVALGQASDGLVTIDGPRPLRGRLSSGESTAHEYATDARQSKM